MRANPTPTSDPWADLVRLLRGRPRSVAEARRRLAGRGHDDDTIERTIRSALDAGLLDDRTFAKLWVTDRLWHHPLSRAAVAQELHDKGVDRSIVDATLAAEYPAVREAELARELAAARFARLAATDADRRRSRTLAYLLRRGFSHALSYEVIRRIEEGTGDD